MPKADHGHALDKGRFLLELYRKALSLHKNELYEYFLNHAVNLTHSKIGFFHFVSPDQKKVILTTWNKEALKNCTAQYANHYPMDQAGNWADCIRLKKPIIYNDFKESPNQKGRPKGHVPIKRILGIPIVERGKVRAIFGVGNKIDPYTQEDVVQLEVIANELNKIIKQRQVESQLVESKEKYHALSVNMQDGFAYCQMLFDEQGKPQDFIYIESNDAFERIMGIKRAKLIGRQTAQGAPEFKKAHPQLFDAFGRVVTTGVEEKIEYFYEPLDTWLSISVYRPRKRHFAAIVENITQRKKTEEALRESEERLRLKLDSVLSPDAKLSEQDLSNIIDVPWLQKTMNHLYTVTNMGFALIDLKGKVLVGTGWQDICTKFHRMNPQTCKNCIESDVELSSQLRKGEIRLYKCKNNMTDVVTPLFIGDAHVANVFFGQFFFEDQKVDRAVFVAQAEKYGFKKADYLAAFERTPRFSREKIEQLMVFYERLSEMISKLSHANLELAKLLSDQKELQLKLEDKAEEVKEYATQMEQLAEERARKLKDAERLSAIGATAGMVGHDIRNPLQAMINELYFQKKDINRLSDDDAKKSLLESAQNMEDNLHYINKIVADLQDFARPLNPRKDQIDLSKDIQESVAIVNIPENVELTIITTERLPPLTADSTMIKRILVNLAQNAVQAMPNGGNLTIRASSTRRQIEIVVEDTGEGIPKEVQAKLFTPLMTTKAKGQGFGLAVVKRMTEAMGGSVTFDSEEGKGTKFILKFQA